MKKDFVVTKPVLNRCFTTGNRSYLPSISDFDAIIMNQRSIDWGDMPKKSQRNRKQYYIMYAFESPDYALMDVHKLDNYFNLTMTYKKISDFYHPYGMFVQKKQHPPLGSPELAKLIEDFGKRNVHLSQNRTGTKTAWFVSHCSTKSRREILVRELQKHIPIQV